MDMNNDQALIDRLSAAASVDYRSPDEVLAQRVSFVMGSISEKSTLTRADVERIVRREAGLKSA